MLRTLRLGSTKISVLGGGGRRSVLVGALSVLVNQMLGEPDVTRVGHDEAQALQSRLSSHSIFPAIKAGTVA